MLNKKANFAPKKQVKKAITKQVFEYKTIEGVPDKYLDGLLVEATPERMLRDFFSKENDMAILKRLKLQHKISKKITALDDKKLKEVSVDYISFDKNRYLYSFIMGANITMMEDFMATKGFDFVYGDRAEFLENIQTLVDVINVPYLVTYIRAQREDLYDIVPWLLAKWEESQNFEFSDVENTYGFDANVVDLEAYDIEIDFDECELDEDDIRELSSLDLESSMLFNKDNIKNTVFLMKECLDALCKKAEDKDENADKVKELEKTLNENKKLINKIEKKLKNREIRVTELESENEILNEKLEIISKKLQEQEEVNKQNKLKIEDIKREKREINKQNKSNIEKLEIAKVNLDSKIKEIEEIRRNELDINNIKETYEKTLEEVRNASLEEVNNVKNECIELQNKLYVISKEKEETCNIYENKLHELTKQLQLANQKDVSIAKEDVVNVDDTSMGNDMYSLDDYEDFGDLFSGELDNNPTYSR